MDQKYSPLLLEKQLCFPLYACSRELIKRSRPYLDKLGLTYTQYAVMQVIWEMGTVSVRDLGNRLYLDSGTLTPVLKTLEKQQLILRARSRKDERVLLVTATEEGLALREEALSAPEMLEDCPALEEQERQVLHQLLNKILHTAKKD